MASVLAACSSVVRHAPAPLPMALVSARSGPLERCVGAAYSVRTNALTEEETARHMSALTFVPKRSAAAPASAKPPETVVAAAHVGPSLRVPRAYGYAAFGAPETCVLSDGALAPSLATCTLELRPYQREPAAGVLAALMEGPRTAILNGEVGSGKTATAAYIMHRLARRTLILAHTTGIGAMWADRMPAYFPEAALGKLSLKRGEPDIVLGTIQTYARHPDLFWSRGPFGLVVFDEVHHVPARTFLPAAMSAPCAILGLSATTHRKDGMSGLLWATMGNEYPMAAPKVHASVELVKFSYTNPLSYTKRAQPPTWLKYGQLCGHEGRNAWQLQRLLELLAEGRSILATTDRVEHAKVLVDRAREVAGAERVGLLVGGVKGAALRAEQAKPLKIGTVACNGEGVDLSIDTLAVLNNASNPVQQLGRLRAGAGSQPQLVVLFEDGLDRNWMSRETHRRGWPLRIVSVSL